jgi:hypothetical protein
VCSAFETIRYPKIAANDAALRPDSHNRQLWKGINVPRKFNEKVRALDQAHQVGLSIPVLTSQF